MNEEKEKEIIAGNILIAKSQGWVIDNSFPDKDKVWKSPKGRTELESTLKFHKSWDELQPVLTNLRPKYIGEEITCDIIQRGLFYNKIEDAWNAIVLFLKKTIK